MWRASEQSMGGTGMHTGEQRSPSLRARPGTGSGIAREGEATIGKRGRGNSSGHSGTGDRWMRMVTARVQQPGETLTAYSHAKQAILRRAPFPVTDGEAIRYMAAGMADAALGAALLAARPLSLEDYFSRVRDLDELRAEGRAHTQSRPYPAAGGRLEREGFTEQRAAPGISVESTRTTAQEQRAGLAAADRMGSTTPPLRRVAFQEQREGSNAWANGLDCWHCGGSGHRRQDCPERQRSMRPAQMPARQEN
jgi:hypothetical protein